MRLITPVVTVSRAGVINWTPAGAEQLFPAGGTRPTPLASGDTVQIVLSGTSSDGFPYFGQGSAVVE